LVIEFSKKNLNLFGFCLAKNHFYSKDTVKYRSKGVFAKQLIRPKIPQQKNNQSNKALVPDKKKTIRLTRKHWFLIFLE
jgi:hypothetical protein